MHDGLTDQQFEAKLLSSDEFYQNAGGTDVAWVDAVYRLLLARQADASGEAHWTGQLAAGQTRSKVAESIAGSQENNTQLINDDYFHYLGRSADRDGLAYWLKQFAAGKTNEDLIAGFTGSTEYYKAAHELNDTVEHESQTGRLRWHSKGLIASCAAITTSQRSVQPDNREVRPRHFVIYPRAGVDSRREPIRRLAYGSLDV